MTKSVFQVSWNFSQICVACLECLNFNKLNYFLLQIQMLLFIKN